MTAALRLDVRWDHDKTRRDTYAAARRTAVWDVWRHAGVCETAVREER